MGTSNMASWDVVDANSSRPPTSENFKTPFDISTNSSDVLPIDMQFNDGHLLSIVAYSILFIVATVGNITVLVALLKFRLKPRLSRVNLFLLHLVIADLLVTFLLMPLEIGWAFTVSWKAGDLACRVMSFFRTFGLYLSGFLIVSISVDRYNAVLQPLSLPEANRRGRIMLYCAWIGSILCSIPQALIFHVERHPTFQWFEQCVTFNSFPNKQAELAYSLFGFALMYGFPLCAILFCYSRILYEIYKINRVSKNGGDSTMRRSNLGALGRAKVRTLKLTVTIVCTFFFCWTPYNVMSLWYWIDSPSAQKVDQRIQKCLFLFACTNSCFNPMVYGLFHTRSKSFWVRMTAQRRTDLKQTYNAHYENQFRKEQPYKVRVRWTPRECLCAGAASSSGYASSSGSNLRLRPLYEVNGIPVYYNNIGNGSILIKRDYNPRASSVVTKSLVKTIQVDVNDCDRNDQLHSNSNANGQQRVECDECSLRENHEDISRKKSSPYDKAHSRGRNISSIIKEPIDRDGRSGTSNTGLRNCNLRSNKAVVESSDSYYSGSSNHKSEPVSKHMNHKNMSMNNLRANSLENMGVTLSQSR